jgi:transcriptional regulator with XRE-family HTH domain
MGTENMAPAALKIKKKLLEKGDTIQGLADRFGCGRDLLSKVIHGARGNPELRKKLADYCGTTVEALFGTAPGQGKRAA